MATKEEQETLRLLVQHVSRAFYEPKYVVIMDQLARHPVLKDDDLSGRIGLQAKELNKLMAVLTNDRLVQVHRQNELKEGAQRSIGRQYYFIDYRHFCNVVKWRVAEMRRIIDSTLRNELDNKGYICPQCGKSFSPLEVDKLMDFVLQTFICDICRGELVDNENAESVRGSQDRMQRFNKQMSFVREGLRKSEDMVLPAFDPAMWIKSNITDADKQKAAQNDSGLKIAGQGERREDDGIGVVMSLDKDEATRKREREQEAEAKRQQNVLPAWHLQSTITGDLTALGHAASSRVNGSNSNAAILSGLGSSNSDILNGLGSARSSQMLETQFEVEEDVKPDIMQIQEKTYYDQYYASLAASSVPSMHGTPAADSHSWGSDSDEEDKKPSGEFLDTLNVHGKRSRSREGDDGPDKFARTSSTNEVESQLSIGTLRSHTNGTTGHEQTGMDPTDDPIVNVNGSPMKYSAVTEEHQELMTPEEYTAYFEIYQTRS